MNQILKFFNKSENLKKQLIIMNVTTMNQLSKVEKKFVEKYLETVIYQMMENSTTKIIMIYKIFNLKSVIVLKLIFLKRISNQNKD